MAVAKVSGSEVETSQKSRACRKGAWHVTPPGVTRKELETGVDDDEAGQPPSHPVSGCPRPSSRLLLSLPHPSTPPFWSKVKWDGAGPARARLQTILLHRNQCPAYTQPPPSGWLSPLMRGPFAGPRVRWLFKAFEGQCNGGNFRCDAVTRALYFESRWLELLLSISFTFLPIHSDGHWFILPVFARSLGGRPSSSLSLPCVEALGWEWGWGYEWGRRGASVSFCDATVTHKHISCGTLCVSLCSKVLITVKMCFCGTMWTTTLSFCSSLLITMQTIFLSACLHACLFTWLYVCIWMYKVD